MSDNDFPTVWNDTYQTMMPDEIELDRLLCRSIIATLEELGEEQAFLSLEATPSKVFELVSWQWEHAMSLTSNIESIADGAYEQMPFNEGHVVRLFRKYVLLPRDGQQEIRDYAWRK